jgi:hypothetical protein
VIDKEKLKFKELEHILEHFPIPWNRKTPLDLCLIAFSSREPVSTSLENALVEKGEQLFSGHALMRVAQSRKGSTE